MGKWTFPAQAVHRLRTAATPLSDKLILLAKARIARLPATFPQHVGGPLSFTRTSSLKIFFPFIFLYRFQAGWKLTWRCGFTRIAGLFTRGPSRPVWTTQVDQHETYFPTQHPQARSRSRFPRSHGHQERPCRPVASSRQGPQASDRLITRNGW